MCWRQKRLRGAGVGSKSDFAGYALSRSPPSMNAQPHWSRERNRSRIRGVRSEFREDRNRTLTESCRRHQGYLRHTSLSRQDSIRLAERIAPTFANSSAIRPSHELFEVHAPNKLPVILPDPGAKAKASIAETATACLSMPTTALAEAFPDPDLILTMIHGFGCHKQQGKWDYGHGHTWLVGIGRADHYHCEYQERPSRHLCTVSVWLIGLAVGLVSRVLTTRSFFDATRRAMSPTSRGGTPFVRWSR